MGCVQSVHTRSTDDNVSMVAYSSRASRTSTSLVPVDSSSSSNVVSGTQRPKRKTRHPNCLTPSKTVEMDDAILSTLDVTTLMNTGQGRFSLPSWSSGTFNVVCTTEDESSPNSQRSGRLHPDSLTASTSEPPSKNAFNAIQNNLRRTWENNIAGLLAMNALELTAPASDALLKNRKNAWVQLAGHAGSFAPAGPNTIWKKRQAKDNNETKAYQELMMDVIRPFVPRFYREVDYNGEFFIEMEDLLQHFHDPNIMDIKMGTRTFLESEVKNPVVRKDLYEKMIKLDPNEPTAEENEEKAITKLRYMQFREKGSSTSTLGFRVDAIKMSSQTPNTDLKKVKSKADVSKTITGFIKSSDVIRNKLIHQLKLIRETFVKSSFFKTHEIVGSSLLFMYDNTDKVGVWLIDFAKTLHVGDMHTLNHKTPWVYGNHEDGYLLGLENLIETMSEMNMKDYSSGETSDSINIHQTSKQTDNILNIHQEQSKETNTERAEKT